MTKVRAGVVDAYAQDYDIVARFGGGDNAGHTLVVGTRKLALRIVPSGVLHERPELFIGGGTVVSLEGLIAEFEMLAAIGVDVSRIKISDRAHLVLPYHAQLDRAGEAARGSEALGTTGRGIGPAYTDQRRAQRAYLWRPAPSRPVRDPADERARHADRAGAANVTFDADAVVKATVALVPEILPHVVDGVEYHARRA